MDIPPYYWLHTHSWTAIGFPAATALRGTHFSNARFRSSSSDVGRCTHSPKSLILIPVCPECILFTMLSAFEDMQHLVSGGCIRWTWKCLWTWPTVLCHEPLLLALSYHIVTKAPNLLRQSCCGDQCATLCNPSITSAHSDIDIAMRRTLTVTVSGECATFLM